MKKIIYIILLIIDVALMAYAGYYIVANRSTPASTVVTVATSTEIVPAVVNPPINRTFPLANNKTIIVSETNPNGESMSTLEITTTGFASNTPITLEKNKLTGFLRGDFNQDTHEELVILTTSQASGNYGEATIFTTANSQNITTVRVPELTEEDTKKGALFEGYSGYDSFKVIENNLVREFPQYLPVGGTSSSTSTTTQRVLYVLNEKDGEYFITYAKTPTSLATSTPSSTNLKSTSPLADTSWIWVSYTDDKKVIYAPAGDKFILTFFISMRVLNTTDCNTMSGSASTTKNILQFSPFAMTMRFCEGSKDRAYAEMLSKVTTFERTDTELVLTLSDNNTLTFKKK